MGASTSAGGVLQAAEENIASCSSSAPEVSTPLPSSLSLFALLELPQDCLMRVVSALSALDVCRVARVCRTLRAIADSDDVWASRLPSDLPINPPSLSRKDLYFRLRAGMLHKDLSQPYWLDPETGEGCFVKSARDLQIVWGDDSRYWRWGRRRDSWFAESAFANCWSAGCLDDVRWFEVSGEFESIFMPGVYTASFRIKFQPSAMMQLIGPIELSLSTSIGQYVESRFSGWNHSLGSNPAQLRALTTCSWMELNIGDFLVPREMHVKLEFCMFEKTRDGGWKYGFEVDSIKIQLSRNEQNIGDSNGVEA